LQSSHLIIIFGSPAVLVGPVALRPLLAKGSPLIG
jgi:hypothetical protein